MKTDDYVKTIKKVDREVELENNPGFKSKTRIHRSEKKYNRKRLKKVTEELVY